MNPLYRPFQPTLTEQGLQRFGISLRAAPACATLNGIVHSYLQISAVEPTPYPVIPDGTQAVFISPLGSMIGGAQSQARDIQILQPGEYFGIRFYPGALRNFFNLNLAEITDQYADSQYFPCRDFSQLHLNVFQSPNFLQRAALCETWLLRRLNPMSPTPFDHALSLIYRTFGNIKVSQLAATIGWSSRHLNRQFRSHTGLGTKTFIQTIRIQHTCKRLYSTPTDSLATAFDLGFSDQAHLLNDYKKRLLLTPTMLFNRFMSDFYNH